jgi:hypothetical protein
VRNSNKVRDAVQAIAESDWQTIAYPEGGEAQIAETTLWAIAASTVQAPLAWT